MLEIDWQGARQMRRLVPTRWRLHPAAVWRCWQRLRGRRQDSPDVIARRLAAARGEIAHVEEFDYVIINDEFDRAVQDLVSIVRAHG